MKRMLSYAQNAEDVILSRIFGSRQSGFYIDIGASHPEYLSVTKHFYDLGWSGINVEPIKRNCDLFLVERPRDINLNVVISAVEKIYNFFEVTSYPELSTLDADHASALVRSGHDVISYPVTGLTANQLFDRYVSGEVDFLKIDVEGGEFDLIHSLDLRKHRPVVLLIEATLPNSGFPGWKNLSSIYNHYDWEKLVLASGYIFAYFDGLNRFYVKEENSDLLEYFKIGLCCYDNFIQVEDFKNISNLEKHAAGRLAQTETLTGMLRESETDRAARGEQIQALTAMLKESETDRAARGEQIQALTAMLKESETDRAARGEQIQALTAMLKESETDRAARGEQIRALTAMLKESEEARTVLFADLHALFAHPTFLWLTSFLSWPEVKKLAERFKTLNE